MTLRRFPRLFAVVVLLTWTLFGGSFLRPSAAQDVGEPDLQVRLEFFESRIRPVLVEHCYECHSAAADPAEGGLRLDHAAGLLEGGDSGPAIVPGDPDASLLLSAIRHDSFEMPPDSRLPESIVGDFERWIGDGAVDPREVEEAPATEATDAPAIERPWSFHPLRRRPVPEVNDAAWPVTVADRFLLARLEAEGLAPAPEADRRTLVRRLYFDLWGLPPEVDAMEAFVRSDDPLAYERLVDRLLASPRFGERWGRHWLDVARFAESAGGGRTRVFHDAWRYRDYVIRSWNEDKPFDRMVGEQIAGDLLDHATRQERIDGLTATGFLVLGPTNYELQDKDLLRMEVVDEQLDTMGRAIMGLTLGCARCHDHKFDPVSARDYYAMAGIFRSTKTLTPGNVAGFVQRALPRDPEVEAEARRIAEKLEPVEAELTEVTTALADVDASLTELRAARLTELQGLVCDDEDALLEGDWKTSTSVKPYVASGYRYAGRGPSTARFEIAVPEEGEYDVRVAHNAHGNRSTRVRVTIEHALGSDQAYLNHRRPPGLEGLFESAGRFTFAAAEPARITLHCDEADGMVIADAVVLVPRDAPSSIPASPEIGELESRRGELLTRKAALERQKADLEEQAPPPPTLVMAVREEEGGELGDSPLCIRGDVHNVAGAVPRGFPEALAFVDIPIPEASSGRRELAEWLTHPDHPLTARVLVNRAWLHLFGEGLVRTPDNFGHMGEEPSHPDLLDHLALDFVDDDYSLKRLVRRLVLSRTYRMSTARSDTALRLDPENRWLQSAHRRRLDAESIRDAILSAAGTLDNAVGGPTIAPDVNSEFGYVFETRRRSVYVPRFRNRLHEVFEVFDVADPNLVSGDRNASTRATQALYLMNSPEVMDAARAAAERLLAEMPEDSLDARVDRAFLRCLGRLPSDREREAAAAFLHETDDPTAAWTGLFHAVFCCVDFRYLD